MTLSEDFEDFIRLLNKFETKYMVVGGYAMAFHGQPRFTGDLDVWIAISEENASKLLKVIDEFGFSSLGFKKEDFLKDNLINQIGYPPLRIDILTSIDGVSFDEAYESRLQISLDVDLFADYVGLDALIKNKSTSARLIDLQDVKNLKKKNKKG